MVQKLVLILTCLIITACTTYGDTTSSQQLTADIHRVSMKGNAFNDASDAQDYALLKAAEITIDNGARYFTIESATDTTRTSNYVAPSTYNSNTTTTANASIYGNQAFGTANSSTFGTYNQGQTYNFVKPGVDVLIKTHEQEPAGGHFDAIEITKYLGVKLNPKRWANPGQ